MQMVLAKNGSQNVLRQITDVSFFHRYSNASSAVQITVKRAAEEIFMELWPKHQCVGFASRYGTD